MLRAAVIFIIKFLVNLFQARVGVGRQGFTKPGVRKLEGQLPKWHLQVARVCHRCEDISLANPPRRVPLPLDTSSLPSQQPK